MTLNFALVGEQGQFEHSLETENGYALVRHGYWHYYLSATNLMSVSAQLL